MDQTELGLRPGDWPLLAILALFLGTTFFYFEIALTAWQPLTIVAIRLVLATVLLWLLVLFLELPVPWRPDAWSDLLVMGLINHALPWSCMVWALQEINSGTAGIINGTVPLFVLLLAQAFQMSEVTGAFASLGMILNALLTIALVPIALALLSA